MIPYEELIEISIQKIATVVNLQVAVRQARKVPDLEVDDEGHVTALRAPGKEVLRELVSSYENIMGYVAAPLIAYELRDRFYLEDTDLPEPLKKQLS